MTRGGIVLAVLSYMLYILLNSHVVQAETSEAKVTAAKLSIKKEKENDTVDIAYWQGEEKEFRTQKSLASDPNQPSWIVPTIKIFGKLNRFYEINSKDTIDEALLKELKQHHSQVEEFINKINELKERKQKELVAKKTKGKKQQKSVFIDPTPVESKDINETHSQYLSATTLKPADLEDQINEMRHLSKYVEITDE